MTCKKILVILILAAAGIFSIPYSFQTENKFKTGDIIFIVNPSGQGKAIQLATGSKYTHVGIIIKEKTETYVYHAVEPVMVSTLSDFIAFSADGKYVVKRLKDSSPLTVAKNEKMKVMASKLLGKHYDIYFSWNDDEWYCSEYVWKLYKQNYNLEIGKLRPLKEFNLTSKEVKRIMEKRYGNKIPYEENMISPGDMRWTCFYQFQPIARG